MYQAMLSKLEKWVNNRALDKGSLILLVMCYAILIFIGTIGNGLVCIVVVRKPKMRTSRNLFIINLAISDLLLCFFTIPFSLVEISVKFWPFGLFALIITLLWNVENGCSLHCTVRSIVFIRQREWPKFPGGYFRKIFGQGGVFFW